ncbi:MAG: DUF3352 domain-containing protein [Solirubrobacterales bacterium]|nr:DUF3352 domain-containing protein [Solirubrobacterales bacterium]
MQLISLRAALLTVLSVLALALAACGGSDSTDSTTSSADLGPDPATMAPTGSPVYGEVVVRPEGTLGDDLNSALSKLLSEEDPGGMIRSAIDEGLSSEPDSGGITYTDDIEPWLGSRAGFFLSGIDATGSSATGAVAIAVTDPDAAKAFIDKALAADPATETDSSYQGVDYKLDSDGAAVGVSGDFLVAGTEQALKDAIDAGAGDSLADDSTVTAALDEAPDNSLFSVYADTPAIVDLIKSSGSLSAAESKQLDEQVAQYTDGPIEAWGTVTDSTFALGASAPTAGAGGPSDLIAGFPSDSWLAFATADVGEQLQNTVAQFETAFKSGFESAVPPGYNASKYDPLAQVEAQTGIDLQTDLAWIGDVGGYIHGTQILGLGGGLVVETSDEAAATKTLDSLETTLQGIPEVQVSPSSTGNGFRIQPTSAPVGAEVAVQDGKLVAGFGGDSIDDVVAPAETLDASDRFSTITDSLGDGATASFFLDFSPVIQLVESSGDEATSDPDYQMAKPYLDALDYIVSGSAAEGDRTTASIVLGVKEATDSSSDATAAVITP